MSDPLGPVVITAREIYDQLVRVVAAVERLTNSSEGQRQDHRELEAEQRRVASDHEARLRALERARWPLPSLAALVSIASFVLAYVALVKR